MALLQTLCFRSLPQSMNRFRQPRQNTVSGQPCPLKLLLPARINLSSQAGHHMDVKGHNCAGKESPADPHKTCFNKYLWAAGLSVLGYT